MPNIQIRKFAPASIVEHRIMLFVGKRGSGKTTLIRDIFYQLRGRFDLVVALAGTMESRKMFEEFVPKCFVHDIQVEIIYKVVDMAKLLVEKGNPRNVLIIMDDCLGTSTQEGKKEKRILDDNIFREIAYNGRHHHLTLAISLQYCMEMRPHLRSQIDYCFVFQETIRSNRKRLYEYFFGQFEDLDSFSKILCKCTQNYECLVLDNIQNTGNLEDNIYYYKAGLNIPQFRLGLGCYWFLNERYSAKNCRTACGGDSGYELFQQLLRRVGNGAPENKSVRHTKDMSTDKLIIEKI